MTQKEGAPPRVEGSAAPRNEPNDRKAFLEALEAARQAVKPLVKKSLKAEDVPNDLLSFRMKGQG